ncbi:MAG: SAM-dependent chlorinase/fluorinase [Bacteroidales bacterium]|jgi:S-adenosylmethionine hydrolase|nr:SAM-dependent chlorinase/fluorinase [Bacteroidales bacterium]
MITLLSDWKLRDPYVGIFKGQLLNLLPNIKIVDITHSLELGNLSQVAFIAKNSYPFFPKKTLHIILSGLSFSSNTKPILIVHDEHLFLGEDTGVFSIMFGTENFEAYQYNSNIEINVMEKLALMASWVIKGNYVEDTTPYMTLKFQLNNLSAPEYNTERKLITGKIAYIDSCCNAVTNIPISMFEAAGEKPFTALISNDARPLKITRCHPFYNSRESEVFLVYNRLGFLEVTLYDGNIAALADIKVGNNVEIQFE